MLDTNLKTGFKEGVVTNFRAEAKLIKKQLVITGTIAILISVGLSGCNENEKDENEASPDFIMYPI
ncbi:MAG TPA: hypothetical protein DSN98_05845 [Thermoplasmata archaeon]|nr:MAG TPA: hypothetical protein DSN98_05845 [Thermoplasmata archaeon]